MNTYSFIYPFPLPPMPKRKISDLWPNECIHCPTEESAKHICDLVHLPFWNRKNWSRYLGIWFYWNIVWCYKQDIIYQRTDFTDFILELTETNIWKAWMWIWETIRPWPFKTGDKIEANDWWIYWNKDLIFVWYATNGEYIIRSKKQDYFIFTQCRHPLPKQQHTISCTDEALEKVKQIDWVDIL